MTHIENLRDEVAAKRPRHASFMLGEAMTANFYSEITPNPSFDKSAESPTLSVRAYDVIHQGLITGRYMPGDHLTLRDLSATMGISITPIREALQRLAAEGSLVLSPNRSVTVPAFDENELATIWRMRVEMEGQACYLAALKATDEQILGIECGMDRMAAMMAKRDQSALMQSIADWSFSIARASQSPTLFQMVRNLRTLTGPRYAMLFRDMDEAAFDNIQHTLQLSRYTTSFIKMRDAEAARDSVRADLQVMAKLAFR